MNKEQLGSLILTSQETMYHIAKTMLYDDADCADAIQESIVKAFSGIHTLRNDRYAKTWLIRILINECYALLRRKKSLIPTEGIEAEQSALKSEDYSDLYEALCRLPEEMRLTVTLYYMEGYRVKEIALIQKTTESAVKNRLLRARKRLRRELEDVEV